jgi:hypothetical protein
VAASTAYSRTFVSANRETCGSGGVPRMRTADITNGTSPTWVTPSSTSGTVPAGSSGATRAGSTGQCSIVRSPQCWVKTGRRTGVGAVSLSGSGEGCVSTAPASPAARRTASRW